MPFKGMKIAVPEPLGKKLSAWLDAGNDPNWPHPRYGIQRAIRAGFAGDLRILLERGADPNASMNGRGGHTVLQHACFLSDPACVSLLLEFGAEVREKYLFEDMKTRPDTRSAAVLELLISAGADIETAYSPTHDEALWYPLQYACMRGMDACARVLLRAGADPHTPMWDGSSCLHAAVESENLALIGYLLEAGVQVDIQDKKGNTPLMWACKYSKHFEDSFVMETIRTLVEAGASLTIRNKKGKQTRDYAPTPEIAELLTRRPKGAL